MGLKQLVPKKELSKDSYKQLFENLKNSKEVASMLSISIDKLRQIQRSHNLGFTLSPGTAVLWTSDDIEKAKGILEKNKDKSDPSSISSKTKDYSLFAEQQELLGRIFTITSDFTSSLETESKARKESFQSCLDLIEKVIEQNNRLFKQVEENTTRLELLMEEISVSSTEDNAEKRGEPWGATDEKIESTKKRVDVSKIIEFMEEEAEAEFEALPIPEKTKIEEIDTSRPVHPRDARYDKVTSYDTLRQGLDDYRRFVKTRKIKDHNFEKLTEMSSKIYQRLVEIGGQGMSISDINNDPNIPNKSYRVNVLAAIQTLYNQELIRLWRYSPKSGGMPTTYVRLRK